MTDNPKIPRDRADLLVIEALAEENADLRAALADLGADLVLANMTLRRLIRELSAVRVDNLKLRGLLAGPARLKDAA